jgi:hypothetical protein
MDAFSQILMYVLSILLEMKLIVSFPTSFSILYPYVDLLYANLLKLRVLCKSGW